MALYAFDGTWSVRKDTGEYGKNTNVIKLHDMYLGTKHLYKGLGTRYGLLGKFLGGAFGVGGKQRIRAALADVKANAANGDKVIDIIGFSRGAALAVHFANVLDEKGYTVRFLGLWDTVAAFGIPIDLFGIPFQRINLGYQLKLPKNVDICAHALAIDEDRSAFRPTRLKGATEFWFKGVHGDIGGQSGNTALSNITLLWMGANFCRRFGDIDDADLRELKTDASAAPSKNFGAGIYEPEPRKILLPDNVHYSAAG